MFLSRYHDSISMKILEVEDIDALKLFNQKAYLLSDRGFIKNHKSVSAKIKWERSKGFQGDVDGPTAEEIESFALTIRFFYRNNEPSSIGNIARIYQKVESIAD